MSVIDIKQVINKTEVSLVQKTEKTTINYTFLVNTNSNANDDTPAGLINRVSTLENLLGNIGVFNFNVNVSIVDNVEEVYVVPVVGVSMSKKYSLIFNNTISGLSASLISWSDDEIRISVKNNTGEQVIELLNFTINEFLTPLNI